MNLLRCPCGNWIGILLDDGRVEVRHRGRRWVGRLDELVCEKCGQVTRFGQPVSCATAIQ